MRKRSCQVERHCDNFEAQQQAVAKANHRFFSVCKTIVFSPKPFWVEFSIAYHEKRLKQV